MNEIKAGLAEGSDEPIIVICSSTKLKIFRSKRFVIFPNLDMFLLFVCFSWFEYNSPYMSYHSGSVQISTLPASKIYLNLDIDVVHAMRQRFLAFFVYYNSHFFVTKYTTTQIICCCEIFSNFNTTDFVKKDMYLLTDQSLHLQERRKLRQLWSKLFPSRNWVRKLQQTIWRYRMD